MAIPGIVITILHIVTAVFLVLLCASHWYTYSRLGLKKATVKDDDDNEHEIWLCGGAPVIAGYDCGGWHFFTGHKPGLEKECYGYGLVNYCTGTWGALVNSQWFLRMTLVMCGLWGIILIILHIILSLTSCVQQLSKVEGWDSYLFRGILELVMGFITLGSCADLGLAAGILVILIAVVWIILWIVGLVKGGQGQSNQGGSKSVDGK
jgi:hypothetical protein